MHDLGVAARYADRLALLDRGSLVAVGDPAKVLDPELLSRVYGHPVHVHVVDGHLLVVPAPRAARPAVGRHTPVDLRSRRAGEIS